VLAHLVTTQQAADPQRDAGLAAQRIARPPGRSDDVVKLALGGGQQFVALARALLGHQRIAAGDQTFARIGRVGYLRQVPLIEQRELKGAALHQLQDLRCPQGGYPVEPAGGVKFVANPRAGDHAAVAHHHHPLERELLAQFGDGRA